MKLQHNNEYDTYGEEDQDRPCKFYWAVVKKGQLETNHGPVLCRDFLGDTLVWKAKEAPPCSIYGWDYTGPVEKKYTSLVITDFGNIIKNIQNILNPIEDELGIKNTQAEVTDDGAHVWVKGDKWWMLTTVHFSWYTTLLRYLTYSHSFKEFEQLREFPTNDWMEGAFDTFKKLPYVLPELKITQVAGTKKQYCNGNTIHDYNGWRSNCGPEYKSRFTEYGEQLRALLA